jgi:hypothetical protein
MQVTGGCHCGYITFRAEADPERTRVCHCTDCQKLTGSAFRVVVPVPGANFELISGEPTVYIKTADSGTKRAHAFCPKCGSPVYATDPGNGPKNYGVRVGTLSERAHFVPKRQMWCRSAQPWAVVDVGERSETQ